MAHMHSGMICIQMKSTVLLAIAVTAGRSMRFSHAQELIGRWGYVRAGYSIVMTRLQRYLGLNFCRVTRRPLGNMTTSSVQPTNREYRMLSESELLRFCMEPELELTKELIRAAFARGDVCVGAVENGSLIGYTWFAFDTAPHLDGMWVAFPPQARYAYKSFVRPAARGEHVASDLSVFGDEICIKRGREVGIGFIDTHNFASYRAARRVGARTVGYAGYVQLFGKAFTFRSPGARKCGFAFYQGRTAR